MSDAKVLPLTPKWEEGIHQFEYTDRMLGYNAATDKDGVANVPARQIGNRTEYLRELVSVAHDFLTGIHRLTNADFTADAAIAEECLQLDAYPAALRRELEEYFIRLRHVGASSIPDDSANMGTFNVLSRLIPLSWHYLGGFVLLELFCSNFTAMEFAAATVIDVVAGDDSMDVDSSSELVEGREYLLCNESGGELEHVTLMAILTETRVRVTHPLKYSRTSGKLADTNLIVSDGAAMARTDWEYVSGLFQDSSDATYFLLVVNRDAVAATGAAWYRLASDGDWLVMGQVDSKRYADGTEDDIWNLPKGTVQFRLVYTGREEVYPYQVHHIFVLPRDNMEWVEDVRRPSIISVKRNGSALSLTGSVYGSLYREEHGGTTVMVSDSLRADAYSQTKHFSGVVTVALELDDYLKMLTPVFVQIRYSDVLGAVSRWSPAVTVHDEGSE